jgi:hypothetical protein
LGGVGYITRAALLASAVVSCCAPTVALGAELTIQGEEMVPSSRHVDVVSDDAAPDGQALRFLNNDRASRSFASTDDYDRILLSLRGDQCGSPPQPSVAIELDEPGNRVWAAPIGATGSYRVYEAFVKVPAGEHTLHVRMTNDFTQAAFLLNRSCSRTLYLDGVTLKDMPSMFAPGSYRNAPLADDAPLDPHSDVYRQSLERYLDGLRGDRARGVNTSHWSAPVYVVPAHQAPVRVEVDRYGTHSPASGDVVASLEKQWARVPLPPRARPADAGRRRDNQLVVYQPETDTLWEFFGFSHHPLTGRPRAQYGGQMRDVSRNPGHFTGPGGDPAGPGSSYGASATSIPLLAGLQRLDELRRGSIDHVVAFNMPNVKVGFCRWPAQRTDGDDWEPDLPRNVQPLPEGIRFRLPPSTDVDDPAMTPYGRMVARAVQRYGMVLTDGGTNFAFEAEDATRFRGDPYAEILGPDHWGADGVLRNFPWGELQALAETSPRPPACELEPPGI